MPRPSSASVTRFDRPALPISERVLLLETDMINHEAVCSSRWGLLMRIVILGGSGALTVILTVLGWTFVQLHNDQQRSMDYLAQQLPAAAHAPPRL